MLQTKIASIQDQPLFDDSEILEDDTPVTIATDLTKDLEIRLASLQTIFEKGGDEVNEIISRLAGMYTLSPVRRLETYLLAICNSNLPGCLKIPLASSLCEGHSTQGFATLNQVLSSNTRDAPTPLRIEAVKYLMEASAFTGDAEQHFNEIVNDQSIDGPFRYRAVLSLESLPIDEKRCNKLAENITLYFFRNTENDVSLRILAGQYLLTNFFPMSEKKRGRKAKLRGEVERTLLSFANDTSIEYNQQADAADVLLRVGGAEVRRGALQVITRLGRTAEGSGTIYTNAQNVHDTWIEGSVMAALEFLHSMKVENELDLVTIERKLKKYVKKLSTEDREKVKLSFSRINLDRALYSSYNVTLSSVLAKVYAYAQKHESRKEIKKRLVEELVDMSGTCSTGFLSRIVNVMSGFGDFSVTISFEAQIIANFAARLNAMVMDIDPSNIDWYSRDDIVEVYARSLGLSLANYLDGLTLDDVQRQEAQRLILLKQGINPDNVIQPDTTQTSEELEAEKKLQFEQQIPLRIRALEEYRMAVVNEMTLAPSQHAQRVHLYKFYTDNVLKVREQLYEEFKDNLAGDEFDLYFRKAIAHYEGQDIAQSGEMAN